jgi:hypothetical protein
MDGFVAEPVIGAHSRDPLAPHDEGEWVMVNSNLPPRN